MTAVGETAGGAAGRPQHQKVSRPGFGRDGHRVLSGSRGGRIAEAFLPIGPDVDDVSRRARVAEHLRPEAEARRAGRSEDVVSEPVSVSSAVSIR
jgi:hypothetical protein